MAPAWRSSPATKWRATSEHRTPYLLASLPGRPSSGANTFSPRARVGERHVEVRAAAEVVGEGLGHEGRHRADRLRDLLRHEAQKDEAVGHRERVRVAEVELVLPSPALLIVREEAPAELLHVLRDGFEEGVRLGGERQVVAGVGTLEARPRDGPQRAVVALAQHEELGLDAEIESKPHVRGALEGALEQRCAGLLGTARRGSRGRCETRRAGGPTARWSACRGRAPSRTRLPAGRRAPALRPRPPYRARSPRTCARRTRWAWPSIWGCRRRRRRSRSTCAPLRRRGASSWR